MLTRSSSLPFISFKKSSIVTPRPQIRATQRQHLHFCLKSFYSSNKRPMRRRQTKEQVLKNTMRGVTKPSEPDVRGQFKWISKGIGRKNKKEKKDTAVAHPSARCL